MKKIADLIFEFLVSKNITQVFLVTGGGAMHMNNSILKTKGLKYICNHNEQACTMAAEGYARITNKPAIACVTSGPGAINAINGVFGAYTDSIPMIVISGQAKRETLKSHYPDLTNLRQLGDQEVDIVNMVSDITKYAKCITKPETVLTELNKALKICQSGRPGPVWLDIPVDVQGSFLNEDDVEKGDFTEYKVPQPANAEIIKVIDELKGSKRPVLIVSNGINLSNANKELLRLVDYLRIPIVTAWAHDCFDHNHYCYVGKQGTIGDRSGNFSVQSSDLVIIIGSRMPIRQVSYNWENFAPNAKKIQIDIDELELKKPTLDVDIPIHSDAKIFIECLYEKLKDINFKKDISHETWLEWCRERKFKYPVLLPHHFEKNKPLNPYYFLTKLNQELSDDSIVVCGNATACIVAFQTFKITSKQRIFSNSGSASMGYDLPAAIGAATADLSKQIICLAGDGSIQMNIQELQTIYTHNLNIKIFVLSNGGYLSIKLTQENFFGNSIGSGVSEDLGFPNFLKIGQAYGLKTFEISEIDFDLKLREIIQLKGPLLVNVVLDQSQGFEPKLSSRKLSDGTLISSKLEDMAPFLDREELESNIIRNE